MSNTHELKTIQPYFNAVMTGSKNFELRKFDRNYELGDILLLHEYNPFTEKYSGKVIRKTIKYILTNAERFGLMNGYCILGLE